MSIYHGSIGVIRYRILGLSQRTSLQDLSKNFCKHQARPLKLSGVSQEWSFGWVKPLLADADLHDAADNQNWDLSDCRFAEGVLLRMRIERRSVPSQLLQLVSRERIMKKLTKRSKPLTKAARKEIMDQTKDELIDRALPAVSFVDGYWNWQTKQLMIYSTATRACAMFEELFHNSFVKPLSLNLVKLEPPLIGLSEDYWHKGSELAVSQIKQLSLTTPVSFTEHTT